MRVFQKEYLKGSAERPERIPNIIIRKTWRGTSEGFEDNCEKIKKIFLLGFLIKSSMKFEIESSSQQNLGKIILKSY